MPKTEKSICRVLTPSLVDRLDYALGVAKDEGAIEDDEAIFLSSQLDVMLKVCGVNPSEPTPEPSYVVFVDMPFYPYVALDTKSRLEAEDKFGEVYLSKGEKVYLANVIKKRAVVETEEIV